MRSVKCKYCGKQTNTPYIKYRQTKSGDMKKEFYCNEEECNKMEYEKRMKSANRDIIWSTIEDIMEESFPYTYFSSELKEYFNKNNGYDLRYYLEENKIRLMNSLRYKQFVNQRNKARYLLAIILSDMSEYTTKDYTTTTPLTNIQTDINIETKNKSNSRRKRRNLADLEGAL
jgi:hypothetical protein